MNLSYLGPDNLIAACIALFLYRLALSIYPVLRLVLQARGLTPQATPPRLSRNRSQGPHGEAVPRVSHRSGGCQQDVRQ